MSKQFRDEYFSLCSELFLLGWVQYENHIYLLFTDKKTWISAKVGEVVHINQKTQFCIHILYLKLKHTCFRTTANQ